jgi:hypothetical protein
VDFLGSAGDCRPSRLSIQMTKDGDVLVLLFLLLLFRRSSRSTGLRGSTTVSLAFLL